MGRRLPLLSTIDAQASVYDPDTIDFDFDYQDNFLFPNLK